MFTIHGQKSVRLLRRKVKIAAVVGARPQFIKSAQVSKVLREFGHTGILVHTGQYYDDGMSASRDMPEEHNRVVSDHLSNLLFCPNQTAVKNLENEGITQGVSLVGDVMYDSMLFNIQLAERWSLILDNSKLKSKNYALATVHRAENTDNHERLETIFYAFDIPKWASGYYPFTHTH